MAKQWDEYAVDWDKDPATAVFAQSVFDQLNTAR